MRRFRTRRIEPASEHRVLPTYRLEVESQLPGAEVWLLLVRHFSDHEASIREKPSMALHVDEEDDVSAGESWKMEEADQVRESISRPVEGCS
jgi:hypothetical protein